MNTKLIAALALVFCINVAEAGIPVIDIPNLVKNTITSIQSQRQTLLLIQQYKSMTADLVLQTKNLKTVSPDLIARMIDRGLIPADAIAATSGAEVARAAAGVYASLKSGQDEMIKAMQVLNLIDGSLLHIEKVAKSAGLDPNQVIANEARNAAAGRDWEAKNFNDLQKGLSQLQFHRARTDEIMKSLPSASGALSALQANGAQLGVLSDQVSQLIQVQTTASAAIVKQNIQKEDQTLDSHKAEMIAKARKCAMGISKNPQCAEWVQYVEKGWPEALK